MGQPIPENKDRGNFAFYLIRVILISIAIALVYLLLARASLFLVFQNVGIASIWPPSGLALAGLLLNRRSSWPIIVFFLFSAITAANFLDGHTLPTSLAFAFANCAETVLAASLLVRFLDPTKIMVRMNHMFLFFLIVILSIMATALLGAAVAARSFNLNFWWVWLNWWIANGLGAILVTPLILAWMPGHKDNGTGQRPWKTLEGLVLVICVAIVTGYLFLIPQPIQNDAMLRSYLLFPFLIWGGLRFNNRFVTSLLAFTSLVAIFGTLNGLGQFFETAKNLNINLLSVQLYLGVLIFTTLLLNSILKELKQTEEQLSSNAAKHNSLFENASIGIFHSLPGAGFLKVNPTLAGMLGYDSPQEMVSTITNIPAQLYMDSFNYEGIIEKTLKREGWTNAINHYRRKDGSLMIGRLSVRKVLDEKGKLDYLEGFVEDITEQKRAEDALKQSESLLNESQAIANVGGWEYDCVTKNVTWTREVYSIYGVSEDYDPNNLAQDTSFYAPEDQKMIDQAFNNAISAGQPYDLELRFVNSQGGHKWVRNRGNPVTINGQVSKVTGTIMDISERIRAQSALAHSEEQLRLAMEASTDGLWDWHCQQNYSYFSPGYCRMLGYESDEIPNNLDGWLDLVHPEDQERVRKIYEDCRENQIASFELEMRMHSKMSGWKWILNRGRPVSWDGNGKTLRIIGTHVDITERKQVEEALRRANRKLEKQAAANNAMQALLIEQATHDALTGLYNRRFMDDALQREISRANREAIPVSVLMLDIDRFKGFNDTFGHEAGDQVLVALSSLLRLNIRESDIACRFGGEEFIIIMPGANAADARHRAEILCQDFSHVRIGPEGLSSTISIGLAVYPQHGTSVDDLLRAADFALYSAKNAGRNCVMVWGG